MHNTTSSINRQGSAEKSISIPPQLRPVVRAYALGYLTSAGPHLFGFLRLISRRDLTVQAKLQILYRILVTPTQIHRFPTAGAIIVGGATILPRVVRAVLQWIVDTVFRERRGLNGGSRVVNLGDTALSRLRFITSFFSAWLAFDLLNRDTAWSRKRALSFDAAGTANRSSSLSGAENSKYTSFDSPNQHHLPDPNTYRQFAGKTIDFTLFAFCRALDAAVVTVYYHRYHNSPSSSQRTRNIISAVKKYADPSIFALSATLIMHAWFYSPHRLPRTYNRWISRAADIDPRLIQALRLARQGDFVYGQDTGVGPLLGGLAKSLNLPEEQGDPNLTIPIPCEIVHSGHELGMGKIGCTCEAHALSRWIRTWLFALKLYLPIQLLARARQILAPSKYSSSFSSSSLSSQHRILALSTAIKSAFRSSSFLATFVSTFYYAVCLSRTRLGPTLLAKLGYKSRTVTAQMLDSGLCVLTGCLACGLSIFVEKGAGGRRGEIAFFVAPRALGTLVPRVYSRGIDGVYLRREQVVFAVSVAFVMGILGLESGSSGGSGFAGDFEGKARGGGGGGGHRNIRGVLGNILASVVKDT